MAFGIWNTQRRRHVPKAEGSPTPPTTPPTMTPIGADPVPIGGEVLGGDGDREEIKGGGEGDAAGEPEGSAAGWGAACAGQSGSLSWPSMHLLS